MSDDSSIVSLANKLGEDFDSALSKAIAQSPGAIKPSLVAELTDRANSLRKALGEYKKAADRVDRKSPTRTPFQLSYDYLNSRSKEVAQEFGVPDKYNDKDYKKLFNIGLSKVLPFMKLKGRSQDKINVSTKSALALMSSLYGAVSSNSLAIPQVYKGIEPKKEKGIPGDSSSSASDDDETDLERDAGEIEREVGLRKKGDTTFDELRKNKNKKKNKKKRSKKKQRKEEERIKKEDEKLKGYHLMSQEDYDIYLAAHKAEITAPSEVLASKKKEILNALAYASPASFRTIAESAKRANNLAIVLEAISQYAQQTRQPAIYIACSSIVTAIQEIYKIIRSSVALNKKSLSKMNKALKETGDLSNLFRKNSQ